VRATWVGTAEGPEGSTLDRRSPAAFAHDPPVRRVDWTTDRALAGDDFLAHVREHLGLGDAEWDRLLRHAGIFVAAQRLEPERLPRRVPGGVAVVCYLFEREPVRPALPDDAVLLDRDGLVAVAKPPWFTTQGSRASRLSSLERLLRERLACPELRPCNRLDRETSGVVLFARTGEAASRIGKQLQARTVEKEYLAVCCPPPEQQEWEVAGELVRVPHPAHSLFDLREDGEGAGRASRTVFAVLERRGERALLSARPITGRTHQIRVHAAGSGAPLVGDSLYGRGWDEGQPPWSARRLQLHARRVALAGEGGETLVIEAPPPDDFGLSAT